MSFSIFSADLINNLLMWAGFGLLIGIITHLLDRSTVRGGIFGTILTGILGAVVGGFLANLLFGLSVTGFNIQSIIIAVGGALILSLIQRILFKNHEHIRTKITRID